MTIKERIQNELRRVLSDELPRLGDVRFEVGPPRQKEHGDFATNIAMAAARGAGQSPMALARRLAERLEVPSCLIASLEIAAPGFINMYVSREAYSDKIREIAACADDRAYAAADIGGGRAVQVEFVSANPTGPLNVVSARAAAVGDALVRLLARIGYDARSEFYVNDTGTQVELLGLSLEARFRQLLGEDAAVPESGYPGEYLVPTAHKIQHLAQWADTVLADESDRIAGTGPGESLELVDRFVSGQGGTSECEDLETWRESYLAFMQDLKPDHRLVWAALFVCKLSTCCPGYEEIQSRLIWTERYRSFLKGVMRGPARAASADRPSAGAVFVGRGIAGFRFDFGRFAVEDMLAAQRASLERFGRRPDGGLHFDSWVRESNLRDGVTALSELLLRDGRFVAEKEGAVWLRGASEGVEVEWVIRRSTGRPTYFLSDIAYHIDKRRRGFERVIDIWGPDHHGHIGRMQAAMRIADEVMPDLRMPPGWLEILIAQQVNLVRHGQRVQMSKRAGEYVTLDDLIEEVGADVARFFFLMRRCNSHLDFDLDLAKTMSDENPVYYVQYAHARISSILRFAAEQGWQRVPEPGADLSLLTADEESDLVKALAGFDDVVRGSAVALEPHRIPMYLIDLAARFHRFYHNHRVVTDDRALSAARLYLCYAVRTVLRSALFLIGVSAPDTM